jgi:two-component system, chemotaxis family, sensor kinase CheA
MGRTPERRNALPEERRASRPLAVGPFLAYSDSEVMTDPAERLDELSMDLMVRGVADPHAFTIAIEDLLKAGVAPQAVAITELHRLRVIAEAGTSDFGDLLSAVGQLASTVTQTAAEESLGDTLHWDLSASPALIEAFTTEARERLVELERLLLIAERGEADRDTIDAAFRAMHNLKGEAAALELVAARVIAHRAEDLLGAARAGAELSGGAINALLRAVDTLRTVLGAMVTALGQETVIAPLMPDEVQSTLALLRNPESSTTVALAAIRSSDAPEPRTTESPAPSRSGEAPLAEMSHYFALPIASDEDERRVLRWMQVQASLTAISTEKHELPAAAGPSEPVADDGIRVPVTKLDSLIALTSDIHGLLHHLGDGDASTMARTRDRLSGLVERLQHASLTLRLVPIADAFQRLQRVARDTARQVARQVEVHIEHGGVEIDKGVVDRLAGPLMHLVRNAIDHGLENPAERTATGKSTSGHLRLIAAQRGNRVEITVVDDGKGLDVERIRAKAVEQGLIGADEQRSADDIFPLIFLPGFSTAKSVTDISGRGVGLDVVREAVEDLGGSVTVSSIKGEGTRFILDVPLTLMLQEGLIAACAGRRLVALQQHVHEVVPLRTATVRTILRAGELIEWRGSQIPLIRLREHLTPGSPMPHGGSALIITGQGEPFALVVDEVLGGQRVVVRAMPRLADRTPGLMGAALLNDGGLALVIDPIAIARKVLAKRIRTPETERVT